MTIKYVCLFVLTAVMGLALGACTTTDDMQSDDQMAESTAPFGGSADTRYASNLWQAMKQAKLVGPDAIESTPYTGQHPHGAILQNLETSFTLNGNTGPLFVKRNYGGEGVSKEAVANNPDQYLKAITIMYQRTGYDPDNNNWYWAKYLPDGSLDKNPKGMSLAGRVAKGNPSAGCIACHSNAPGNDLVFTHDRYTP